MKQVFTIALLLFGIIHANAQISVGIKTSHIRSEYTSDSHFELMSQMIKGENDGWNTQAGLSVSGLIQVKFNKYFSAVVEPGFTKRKGILFDDLIFIDIAFFEPFNQIHIEVPLKLKLRAPLFENKLGIFTTIGINADKFAFEYQSGDPLINRSSSNEDSILSDWNFHKIVGIGADINLGSHQFFIDCDFLTGMGENIKDLKEVQLGIGYMWEI